MPNVDTFDRVLRATGFTADVMLVPGVGDHGDDDRGRELIEVLELAEMFPARHSPTLTFPRFAGVDRGDTA